MPELRKDPVVGRWIIIAPERAKRPDDFKLPPVVSTMAGNCPFCEGHEKVTPKEIFAVRKPESHPNEAGWSVRVVPNKFPALMIEGDLDKHGEGLYDIMRGVGAHEVIIESPKHIVSLTELSVEEIQHVINAYCERMQDLKKDVRLTYALVFKNVGETAGASLEHSHSQMIVTPIVPYNVEAEMKGAKKYYDYRGRCLFCDMAKQEISFGERIVAEEQNFVAFAPFAPRFAFETWILPKKHSAHFENTPKNYHPELAHLLKTTLSKIEKALNKPPYNYLIHSSPFDTNDLEYYHWHMEIIPRITRVAGFEWGTGFYINPVQPENAAKFLRDVK
ncbi:MAG: galactose-1-phosphate uridylyltransferase [Planctomycetes bacterium]|nr:galactose-1-phosphate uridylyltransferase [Planctomycetota bacterium]